MALTVGLCVRATRIRLVVGPSGVDIVNLWRRRRLAWDDIDAIAQRWWPSLASIRYPIRVVTFRHRDRLGYY